MKILGINTKSSSSGLIRSVRAWNRNRLEQRTVQSPETEEPDTLCVLGILKNEELAIDEWIEHYLWQGADKIILIDNGSTDSSHDRIQSWLKDDRISCIRLDRPYRQREHYWTAIKQFDVRKKWKWLLIADLDEFWFAKEGQPLCRRLADYQGIDVVYCNWSIFGCPDDAPHPESLRKSLRFRHPKLWGNGFKKYLVRASKLSRSSMVNIHYVKGLDSAHTISDNINLQINHYYTQSRNFWTQVKMTRGDAHDPLTEHIRVLRVFEDVNSGSVQEDGLLADLVEQQQKAG